MYFILEAATSAQKKDYGNADDTIEFTMEVSEATLDAASDSDRSQAAKST